MSFVFVLADEENDFCDDLSTDVNTYNLCLSLCKLVILFDAFGFLRHPLADLLLQVKVLIIKVLIIHSKITRVQFIEFFWKQSHEVWLLPFCYADLKMSLLEISLSEVR